MNRIWRIKDSEPDLSRILASSLSISPITAQLLINRGIKDELQAQHFLYGDIDACHNAHLLKDGEKSSERIKKAIKSKENILIYGDYDVDGITSVALFTLVLNKLGAHPVPYIPNRLLEGYGLNESAIKFAKKKKIKLIVTADCGISAHKEVKLANSLGMDVIITDHHEIKSEDLPEAYSIVNPLQKDCSYPFKYLSGVGIVYKLSKLLLENTSFSAEDNLDLVALGTVSDVSIQKGENRILTKLGLEKLTNTTRKGIKALMKVGGISGKNVSCSHIGYILGPRINAMGRIGSPEVALKLLLTENEEEAIKLANIMNKENRSRQKIEKDVLKEALLKLEREINFKDTRVIVLASPGWHPGVIGIVASRIVDKFYRPAIILTLKGNKGKGSGRSIDGFHLFNAISACSEYLVNFGGHAGACGLEIKKENIEKFTSKINDIAKIEISDEDLYPKINVDVNIELSDITENLINEIGLLMPFGPGNTRPVFATENAYLRNDPKRISKNGFKMWVTDEKTTCEAISFKGADIISVPQKGEKIKLAYSPTINTWQGVSSLQLDLKDFKVAI